MIATWARLLETKVAGRPLAVTRLLVAAAALVWLRGVSDRFGPGFAVEQMHLGWPVVGDRLIGLAPVVPWTLWAIGAVVLASGLWARAGAGSLAMGVAIFLAADRQHYANGTYLLLVVSVLLVFADSGASWTPWGPDLRRATWWPNLFCAVGLWLPLPGVLLGGATPGGCVALAGTVRPMPASAISLPLRHRSVR